jgi:DNA-binding transcriptional LysR family regulator
MLIDRINLNHIRIFVSVYENLSMTKAAHGLHMTQSGVSQHIKVLEDHLGVKLFERIKQRLNPTPHASNLYLKCQQGLIQIEEALHHVGHESTMINGVIKIGLLNSMDPMAFMGDISPFFLQHKHIEGKFFIECGDEFEEKLMKGQLDLVFTDDHFSSKNFFSIKRGQEKFSLFGHEDYLWPFENRPKNHLYFQQLDYIDQSTNHNDLTLWFKYHLGKMPRGLNIKYWSNDLHFAVEFILNKWGVGILPNDLGEKMIKSGHPLVKILPEVTKKKITSQSNKTHKGNKTSHKSALLKNSYLVYSKTNTPHYSTQLLIDFLKNKK